MVEPTALVDAGVAATLGIVVGPWADGVPKAVGLIMGGTAVAVAAVGMTAGAVVDRGTDGLGAGRVAAGDWI